jgi:hypothetical protein
MAVKKENSRNPVTAILFLCYAVGMVFLLFDRNPTMQDGVSYWEQVRSNCNFVPWHTVGNYWDVLTRPEYYIEKWEAASVYRYQAAVAAINILGNIVMFVPLGVFLPMLWPKLQKAWKAIPVGVLTIVLIELCQLFTLRGRCDVDDLLLNVPGIILGYAGWRFYQFCRKKRKKRKGGA